MYCMYLCVCMCVCVVFEQIEQHSCNGQPNAKSVADACIFNCEQASVVVPINYLQTLNL